MAATTTNQVSAKPIDARHMRNILDAAPLSQGAVAECFNVSGRSVRDWRLQRQADGTYRLRDIIAFAQRRGPAVEIDDDSIEQALRVAEEFLVCAGAPAALEALVAIDAAHGDAGLLVFLRSLIGQLADQVGSQPVEPLPAVECEKCHAVRHGRRWRFVSPLPEPRFFGKCEKCEAAEERDEQRAARRAAKRIDDMETSGA